ncbi:hypothetical protein [Gordonia malaquae]|uniref:hypothetical protein n=1 Tax=Gordonia malaquae TaxID=410332 RepID=UPI003015D686
MTLMIEITCDDCGSSEEITGGMVQGNLTADLNPADQGWFSDGGQDYCPQCADRHTDD